MCYHDGAALVTEWGGDMDWRAPAVWVTERQSAVCLLRHTCDVTEWLSILFLIGQPFSLRHEVAYNTALIGSLNGKPYEVRDLCWRLEQPAV